MNEDLAAKIFEDEVRRIARELWPEAQYDGAAIALSQERDGIFETPEIVHLLEATVSRTMAKAEKDAEKLTKLEKHLRQTRPDKLVKCWFVTREEPTADQRGAFKRLCPQGQVQSLHQFRKRLIDAASYLQQRWNYTFGSVRDPEKTDNATELDSDFDKTLVPLGISTDNGAVLNVIDLAVKLANANRFVLVGDYGVGKSTTMREIFRELRKLYLRSAIIQFPLLLNLRDHHGQDDPTEALHRHARKVGAVRGEDLVRAWRAGYASILLDGFDEIGTTGLAVQHRRLPQIRFNATALIRAFVRETPTASGLIIGGRRFYFDSPKEMHSALGTGGTGSKFCTLSLSDFTEDQIAQYFARRHLHGAVPAWIPARPLLLSYLIAQKMLDQINLLPEIAAPAVAWDDLFDRVCDREKDIEAGVDASAIRKILERLASVSRGQSSEMGEFTGAIIAKAFEEACGFPPDDRGMSIIQRLPSLGVKDSETGTRSFIDEMFAQTASAGDVAWLLEDPFNRSLDARNWARSLSGFSLEVLDARCEKGAIPVGNIVAALKLVTQHHMTNALGADLIRLLSIQGRDYSGTHITVSEVTVPLLEIGADTGSFLGVEFANVWFSRVELSPDVPNSELPTFRACCILELDGRASREDLPGEKFADDVEVASFLGPTGTTSSILDLDLPLRVRVLLTILRKLYLQSGSGRRESALFRGLSSEGRQRVPEVIALLRQNGFITAARYTAHTVWLPVRTGGMRDRVIRILKAPNSSTDALILEAKKVT